MAEMMLIPKADLIAGYDAIRAKGVPGKIVSGQLAEKIESIQTGGGSEIDIPGLISGKITTIHDKLAPNIRPYGFMGCYVLVNAEFDSATFVDEHGFENCYKLETVGFPKLQTVFVSGFFNCNKLLGLNAPELTEVKTYGFGRCYGFSELVAPKLKTIGDHAFYRCDRLKELNLPSVTTISSQAFRKCADLEKATFNVVETIGSEALSTCNLSRLILPGSKVCVLEAVDALMETPIATGTGYIYVPKALIEQYKVASNWSTYVAQFRAIEDYPAEI